MNVVAASAQGFSQPQNYSSSTRVQVWNQPGQENTYHTGVHEWNQKRTASGHPELPTEPPAGADLSVGKSQTIQWQKAKPTNTQAHSTQLKRGVVAGAVSTGAISGARTGSPTGKVSAATALRKQQALDAYVEAQRNLEKARIQEYYEERAQREIEVGKLKSRQIINNAPPQRPQVWSRSTDDSYVPLSERIPGYVPYSIREGSRPGNLGTGPVKANADSIYTSPTLEAARLQEQMGQERADAYRQKAKEAQAQVDQSMANLKSQLKNSNVPGAAKLQNEGSNLYVRNYSGPKGK